MTMVATEGKARVETGALLRLRNQTEVKMVKNIRANHVMCYRYVPE